MHTVVRAPGIEPGIQPWQGCVLPLDHASTGVRGRNRTLGFNIRSVDPHPWDANSLLSHSAREMFPMRFAANLATTLMLVIATVIVVPWSLFIGLLDVAVVTKNLALGEFVIASRLRPRPHVVRDLCLWVFVVNFEPRPRPAFARPVYLEPCGASLGNVFTPELALLLSILVRHHFNLARDGRRLERAT